MVPNGDADVEGDGIQTTQAFSGLGNEARNVSFIAAVTNECVGGATFLGNPIRGGLRGDRVDVSDSDRGTFPGGQDADRSPDSHRRVVLAIGLLAATHNQQTAAPHRPMTFRGARSGNAHMGRQCTGRL
jgi:hypothetical protein